MSETTLPLPLEALPVVTAPASDTQGAPTAPTTQPDQASADFARLLAGELSPGEEQAPEPVQVMDTEQPAVDPLRPPSPELVAALPGGKDLPPDGGTLVPLSPVQMPAPIAAPLPDPKPEAMPAPPPDPLQDIASAETGDAPVPGPVSPAAQKQLAESPPSVLPASTREARQTVEQRPTPSATNPVQLTAADPRAPAAPETSVSTSTSIPDGEVSEEALLAKSAEGQLSQASAARTSGEPLPSVSTHSTAQPTLNQADKHASLPPRLDLPEPMRTPQWNDNLGSRINWMANNQVQTAELRLNPPQLGTMEVRVAVQQDETRVVFTANNAVVREAIEAALPRLRELMGANGLNLVQVDVSEQGQGDRGQPGASNEPVADRATGMSTAPTETETVTTWGPAARGDGLFDDYA